MPPQFSRRLDIAIGRNQDVPPEAEGIIGRTMANIDSGTFLVSLTPVCYAHTSLPL